MKNLGSMDNRIITLTTDFGVSDPFVGIMKGVILGINPGITIVDLCHEVEPGNIVRASYVISSAIGFFPPNTIHVIVVDPGVGSNRKNILVKCGNSFFLSPDNGVLTFPLKNEKIDCVVEILNHEYFLKPVSATFHGRDIFSPVAAHLSLGKEPISFGKEMDFPVLLELPEPEVEKNGKITGTMVYRDRFGNMETNLVLPQAKEISRWKLCDDITENIPLCAYYASAKEGELSALVNSSGYIELFVKNGNAVEKFGMKEGRRVVLKKRN